eukprot:TRINITY_DN18469_c0_g1_i1.p1 TRINITY_DN18469_c0_g1~~TRINITY_DN18469_c0_g1_i1.p1  ORF type:complete len:253 (-),score=36.82 TRINITY_DN18469_c0_g1_i1:12-716(-)
MLLDLGFSSMQIEDPDRGFSFMNNGPLDMRMDQHDTSAPTAADIINSAPRQALLDMFRMLADERHAKRITLWIVESRKDNHFESTLELARLIQKITPFGKKTVHPATQVFMALRIMVNGELEELQQALRAAELALRPGGRLAVICFHSLESKIVNQYLKECRKDVFDPLAESPSEPSLRAVHRREIKPTELEIESNPRSRSARIRVLERTSAPPSRASAHKRLRLPFASSQVSR